MFNLNLMLRRLKSNTMSGNYLTSPGTPLWLMKRDDIGVKNRQLFGMHAPLNSS